MKKTLRLALIITSAILFAVIAAFAASADSESILFPVWGEDDEQYASYEVKGEVTPGENNVTVDDGCWKFIAEEAGYYGYDYSNPDSGTSMDIAQLKNGKAETVYTENMPGLCFDWVENGENGYYVFYLETPGTYYIRFSSADSLYRDKEAVPSTDVISFVYFGELESLEIGKDPLYIEKDICLWWKNEEDTPCYISEDVEQWLTFTNGRYKTGLIGSVDKWESGKRIFTYNLGNGPDIEKEVNLIGLADEIESVSFPEGFKPAVTLSYRAAGEEYGFSDYDWNENYPEWVELKFKDGSIVKVDTVDPYSSSELLARFTDKEGIEHWVLMMYLWPEDGIDFCLKVDGTPFVATEAKTDCNIAADFLKHLSSYVYYFRLAMYEAFNNGPAEGITSLFDYLRRESESFSEYMKRVNLF